MESSGKKRRPWQAWNAPFEPILLVINAVCFGRYIALLASGASGGTLVMLSIGMGLPPEAGLAGAITASRKARSGPAVRSHEQRRYRWIPPLSS